MLFMRRHKHKPEAQDLELTTFLNVLVVLMSFLLLSAVFSRIAIQELKLPSGASDSAPPAPPIVLEVIVRKSGIEIGDGRRIALQAPNVDGKYDLVKVSRYLQELKAQHSDKTDATLLVEPEVSYDDVIRVIDTVKIARVPHMGANGKDEVQVLPLFPDVSIGDAP
jgi:biopolymer transport protein ExbD